MNTDETIEFMDAAGNKGKCEVIINNIDKKGPTAEFRQEEYTKDPENWVWIYVTFSEAIDESTLPQGYTVVEGEENTYSKAYMKKHEVSFKVKDVLGNESEELTYTIK